MLLEGPSSFEPRTEIIPGDSKPGETTYTSETKVFSSNPSARIQAKSRTPLITAAVGGLILVAAAAYGVYRYAGSSATAPQRSAANVEIQRLTGDGKTRGAIISPDGKLVAYIRTEGGERSIWIKQIATDTSLQIVKPGDLDQFDNLTFSPDGVYLYFYAVPATKEAASVYRVSSLGGSPTKAITGTFGVEFSPDGKLVSYGRFDFDTNETSFFVANIDGTNQRKIAGRTGTKFFQPKHAWSPDSRSIVAVGGDDELAPGPQMSLFLIPVSDKEELTEIGQRWGVLDDVVWHPSGDSLLLAAAESLSYQTQIWEVSFPAGDVRRLTNNLNGHSSVSITADGNSIVTGEIYSRTALWVSPDLKPENAKQIFPATGDTWGFGWTPDGRLVFSSDRSGDSEIWMIDANGTNAKQLTSDKIFKQVPVASQDGRYIVYNSTAEGGRLERIDLNGGNRTPLTSTTIGADNPDISVDSKWVIFSGYVGGDSRVMRVPISGGDPQILTEYKAMEPRYSHDGTRFACFIPNETTGFWTRVAIVPAEGGAPMVEFDAPPNTSISRGPVWMPDDKGITVVINEGEKQNLWFLASDGSAGKRMTDFEVPGIARRDFSRDGKRIAIMRAEGIGNAIMITKFR